MSQTTLEVFEEKRITYRGKNPDLCVACTKEDEKGIQVELKINLSQHDFDEECDVFFQAYDNRGAGTKPYKVGKVKEINKEGEENIFQYNIENITKEDARFRVTVSKNGLLKDKKVKRLIGKAEIPGFDDNDDTTKQKVNSLLHTKEMEIGTAFKIEMVPNRVPYLILKKGCNIKHKLDSNSDPIQKTLIYTSAIRTLLETYLSDSKYEDCLFKKDWFKLISDKTGESVDDFPTNYVSIEGDKTVVEISCKNWIEQATETMVSNLIDVSGNKLIDKFKIANFKTQEISFSEEEG